MPSHAHPPPTNTAASDSLVPADGPAEVDAEQVEGFTRPQPRPKKSPAEADRIRVQNRRQEYLERHPEYFANSEHEFADPLLYDSLIRRFQSAAERQEDAKNKGYSRALEGDLMRGEAKLAQLSEEYNAQNLGDSLSSQPPVMSTASSRGGTEALEEPPKTKEEGKERWEYFLQDRFIHGQDEDFDYATVDCNDEFDTLERRDEEDEWFDDEEPSWASDGTEEERMLEGETGIQDF